MEAPETVVLPEPVPIVLLTAATAKAYPLTSPLPCAYRVDTIKWMQGIVVEDFPLYHPVGFIMARDRKMPSGWQIVRFTNGSRLTVGKCGCCGKMTPGIGGIPMIWKCHPKDNRLWKPISFLHEKGCALVFREEYSHVKRSSRLNVPEGVNYYEAAW